MLAAKRALRTLNGRQLDWLQRPRPDDSASEQPAPGPALHVVGLFAGIGGIELGLQRSGHKTALLCEIEPDARRILSHRFGYSDSDVWKDVCNLTDLPSETELLAAGFPCQDLSQAGKTAGIEGSRSGLIDHVFRLLRKSKVEWLLLENVPFMLQLGRGRAMDIIAARLERLGYRWAYRVVDTRSFGLPQRRERVFIVASRSGDPRSVLLVDDHGCRDPVDHKTVACGFYWTEGNRGLGWAVDAVPPLKGGTTLGSPTPPAILFPDGRIVKPDIRDAERLQGFRANWTAPVTTEGARWRLIGNSVSVPVAKWLGARLRSPKPYEAEGDKLLQPGEVWPKAAWNMGEGRFASSVSSWPVARHHPPLAAFLRYEPKLLSVRATEGFYNRVKRSSLKLPDGFLESVARHLKSMRKNS